MLILEHKLRIGNLNDIKYLSNVSIQSTRETISDTIEIDLPKYKDLDPADISEGDEIEFEAGYRQYGLFPEFFGVVREVSPSVPLKIIGEDYSYALRKEKVYKSYKNMSAGNIVKELCGDIDVSKVQDGVNIKYIVFNGISKRMVIHKLAKRCGFDAYMDNKCLIFDKPFARAEGQNIPVFKSVWNIISDSLYYNSRSDIDRVEVIAEDVTEFGKTFKGVYGKGKKIKTVYLDNLTKDEATDRAKEIFEEETYQGFKGDFETFGYPRVMHSSMIEIKDDKDMKKDGTYRVDVVEKIYGEEGFRQIITLGGKE